MVRSVGLNCIARGDYEGGISISRRSLDADPDEPQFMTMLGFFLEQSGYNDEGLAMSARSLALDPTNLYTYHAVGPRLSGAGGLSQGPRDVRARGLARALRPHPLASRRGPSILGYERLTRDYWGSTTPAFPCTSAWSCSGASRCCSTSRPTTRSGRSLPRRASGNWKHADVLTLWMHHWIGLAFARAGETSKAERQVAYLRRLPEGRASGYWSTQGADILEGEFAIIRGDEAGAVQLMATPIRRIHRIGGGRRGGGYLQRPLWGCTVASAMPMP